MKVSDYVDYLIKIGMEIEGDGKFIKPTFESLSSILSFDYMFLFIKINNFFFEIVKFSTATETNIRFCILPSNPISDENEVIPHYYDFYNLSESWQRFIIMNVYIVKKISTSGFEYYYFDISDIFDIVF